MSTFRVFQEHRQSKRGVDVVIEVTVHSVLPVQLPYSPRSVKTVLFLVFIAL
jgi:hypothetical protein